MAEERTFGAGLLHDKIDPRTGLPTVGLFQDPDGSSWVREPDYTETRLPSGGGGGGPPTGAAGGALAGIYPNPDLAAALAGAGLSFLANVVSVNVDGTTVEIVGDVVGVKDGGITPVKLSFDPATQAELDALAAVVAALDGDAVKDGDAAGGVLSGTYPNPGFAVDMATQAELDTAIGTALKIADFDAKGDLLVGTANDAFDQLAVGATNGQVLTVASAQSTGLSYALPPGFELGYAQITADAVVTATADPGDQIVSLGAITYAAVPTLIEFYYPAMTTVGAVASSSLRLMDGNTVLNILAQNNLAALPSAGRAAGGTLGVRFTPSAGSHTYRVTGLRSGGTSFTVEASAFASGSDFAPTWIRATIV